MANKKTDPCWDGYTQVGMKMKNGKKVPNCVPDRSGRISNSKPRKKVSKQMCAKCGCGCKAGKPAKGCKCTCATCKAARTKKAK